MKLFICYFHVKQAMDRRPFVVDFTIGTTKHDGTDTCALVATPASFRNSSVKTLTAVYETLVGV
jgi:hypothetical protein